MTFSSPGFRAVLTTIILVFLISGSIGCGFPGDIPHRSDAEMIENFSKNKAKFEELVEMVRHDEQSIGDRFFRIDDDWTGPEDLRPYGISSDREREYRRIFYELGIPRGFAAYGKGDRYTFIASSTGLAVSGSSKSYVWSKEPPERLVLEDVQEYVLSNGGGRGYRPINEKWYIGFETD